MLKKFLFYENQNLFFFSFFFCVFSLFASWINKWSNFFLSWTKMSTELKASERNWVVLMAEDRWQPNRSSLNVLLTLSETRTAVNWWKISKNSSLDNAKQRKSNISSISSWHWEKIYYLLVEAFTWNSWKEEKNCLRKHKDEKWWKCNEGNNECQRDFQTKKKK